MADNFSNLTFGIVLLSTGVGTLLLLAAFLIFDKKKEAAA